MTDMMALGHRFADEFPELCLPWNAAQVPEPSLAIFNDNLATELGLDPGRLSGPEGVGVLAGNLVPEGATPVALGYAGHQFGNYSPRLGDGRALLLGELTKPDGRLVDIHLKGSGRTPFARGGDGKATLGPMLREYIVSEAMCSMSVPTTRSLSVVMTGEGVYRDGIEPGAVLTRVAASHIRVGTFEYAIRLGGEDLVRRLADHCIERHHPDSDDSSNRYLGLLSAVVDAQAVLIAKWMSLGFIHGVMNTDNMTISGEGIDYGPCAFMDAYDPSTVFSSIDHGGRYSYGNQARVATWNLARLAETMLGLFSDDTEAAVEMATETVNGFVDRFAQHWNALMAAKLGFAEVPTNCEELVSNLLTAMHKDRLDWTRAFRSLSGTLRADSPGVSDPIADDGSEQSAELSEWISRWRAQLSDSGVDHQDAATRMDSVNPVYIPRNHIVHDVLQDATAGSLTGFEELIEVLSDPFTERPGLERFAAGSSAQFAASFQTFCGT